MSRELEPKQKRRSHIDTDITFYRCLDSRPLMGRGYDPANYTLPQIDKDSPEFDEARQRALSLLAARRKPRQDGPEYKKAVERTVKALKDWDLSDPKVR